MDIKNSPEYRNFVRKIRITGTRLALMSFLYWALMGVFIASSIGILYLIVHRIFYPIPINEFIVMPVLAGVVFGFGIFGLIRKFPTVLATAIRIDDYLKSNERISSAVLVKGNSKFEQALIYESMLMLKSSAVSGMLKKDFRKISAFASSSLAVSVLLLFILPTIHYFVKNTNDPNSFAGNFADSVRILKHSESEWQRAKENNEVMKDIAKLLDDYEEFKNRMEIAKAQKNKFRNPEKQKEALSELSSLRDKIEKQRKELQNLQKDVANMKKTAETKKDNAENKSEFQKKMGDLEKNLGEGEFENFSKTMQNLLDEIKNSEESEKLKEELAKKMSELAERFSSEKMQDLLNQLSQNLNNFDPNELSNDQLQKMLDSVNEMGDLTKLMNNQQLMEMLENQLKLAQDKMTGGCNGCNPGSGQKLSALLAKMQAGGNGSGKKCNGKNGSNENGKENDDQIKKGGSGMDATGAGQGGVASEKDADYIKQDAKLRSKLQAGEIIGQYSKRGMPPSGEAMKKVGKIIDKSRQEAQDAMNDQGFTPDERDLVKKYFDNLRNHFESTESASDK